ncbi:hypothetical protein BDZ45DRAFT_401187 [Acephala macrosclerotiorum]|nr:hypothetical protein BDZ45DRAFT_401187 [Acephala macrosclerotiorum]
MSLPPSSVNFNFILNGSFHPNSLLFLYLYRLLEQTFLSEGKKSEIRVDLQLWKSNLKEYPCSAAQSSFTLILDLFLHSSFLLHPPNICNPTRRSNRAARSREPALNAQSQPQCLTIIRTFVSCSASRMLRLLWLSLSLALWLLSVRKSSSSTGA